MPVPEFVNYQVREKVPAWGAALTKGFGARIANPGAALLGRGLTHIIAGLQFGNLETLRAVRAAGEPYIFVDRAYFGGGIESGRMRITFGGYQQWWVRRDVDGLRAREFGVRLEPWRLGGDCVMVVPPSAAVQAAFGIHWHRDWLPKIRAATDRELVVSPKSDRDRAPLGERLKRCYAVVTWTSNVAVDAICAGVPAFCYGESAAQPVAYHLDEVDLLLSFPRRHVDRAAWAASLAWGQFTVNEVASGFAREIVMEQAYA